MFVMVGNNTTNTTLLTEDFDYSDGTVNSFDLDVTYVLKQGTYILALFSVYIVVCLAIYRYLLKHKHEIEGNYKRILFITSHPDDECMFFGPTILKYCKKVECEVFLLCFSYGDYENQGSERKSELWKSCEILGIPSSNIVILNYTSLPDDPRIEWEEDILRKTIEKYIDLFKCDMVITFDAGGISGHLNHVSIYYALAKMVVDDEIPNYCTAYCLNTINVFRKYSLILDVPLVAYFSDMYFISTLKEVSTIKKAMAAHESQYVWFRKLYMMFSRYVYINTFSLICKPEAQLDIDLR